MNFLIRAPRSEDRRHFWTLCRKLGYCPKSLPPAIAGYIRREIHRAREDGRPPCPTEVRERLDNGRWA